MHALRKLHAYEMNAIWELHACLKMYAYEMYAYKGYEERGHLEVPNSKSNLN
jgi:hypothetical protein